MKKLGDAIGDCWDDAGHMGCGENSEALPPCTPPSKELINLNLASQPTPPIIPPSLHDEAWAGLAEMVRVAESELAVPGWYVRNWYHEMAALGWKTPSGYAITRQNWRKMLSGWWRSERPENKAKIEAAYLAEQKSAAEEKDDPEPQIEITAHHWYECQRTCANFKKGKCIWGARHPAVLYKRNDGFTDRCYHFKPLPLEWQKAWMLDPKLWEPYMTRDQFGQEYLHPGWKTTEKGQRVKAYFDAHPDELEEARWRNDANEPTEAECAAVRAWLAWLARAKARGKKRKDDAAKK